ncbi:MAG: DoxX family protein [Candidatus Caldarchaeum sp.]
MERKLEDAGLLFLRITVPATLIVLHGWQKLIDPAPFIAVLAEKGFFFPKLLGYLSIAAETIFPLLVMLGVATRFSAFVVSINMFIAAFVFHMIINSDPVKIWEKAFIYMLVFVFFTITGPGGASLEKLLTRKGKKNVKLRGGTA